MRLRRSLVLPTTLLLGLQILSQHKVTAEGETCNNAMNGSFGRCVGIRRCNPYLELLRSQGYGAGQLLRSTLCYYVEDNPVVCCPSGYNNPNVNFPGVIPANGESKSNSLRPQQEEHLEDPASVLPGPGPKYRPLLEPECGFSNISHNRVVGGAEALKGAWPWMAALGYRNKKDPRNPKWLCGGSLISARHILTAGHCVYDRYDLFVARLGDHDLYKDSDNDQAISVPIERGIIHPEYSKVNYVNDIAVLRLKREVAFSSAIRPICLPIPDKIRNRDYVRNNPFIAGWGSLYFHGPSASALQEVQLPVVSNEDCKRAFAPYKDQVIDERVMCAGYTQGGKDACLGDSGGPMMFPKSSYYYVIGIVSFGFRCAEPGIPGVYTRVTHFLKFIEDNLV
ncbi:hypothetical protein QAD02_000930 [Eretmocerus hayati]|uniref:Uncharacterized protein n=1 Tax=Eretmocerus hayati TaxID=131215 RepID=A0ACC2NG71_9HYME|nr:hypothetical protein QAD02_000930 [Eretmocerus hayati]